MSARTDSNASGKGRSRPLLLDNQSKPIRITVTKNSLGFLVSSFLGMLVGFITVILAHLLS